jgi:hypothetical protein
MNKFIKTFESYTNINPFSNSQVKELVYHSSNKMFDKFDIDFIHSGNRSTYLEGFYFSNTLQKSFGEYSCSVWLNMTNPIIYDLAESRFDSISIQEAIDAMLRGETSYIINDLIEYGGYEEDYANQLVDNWYDNSDGAIIKNMNYTTTHNTEFIIFHNNNNKKQNSDISIQIQINEWFKNN